MVLMNSKVLETGDIVVLEDKTGTVLLKVEKGNQPVEIQYMDKYSTEVIAKKVNDFAENIFNQCLRILKERGDVPGLDDMREEHLTCSRMSLTFSLLDQLCEHQFGPVVA